MTVRNIQNQLDSLEINSFTQLESNDIDYWWQIKFKKIQSDKTISGEKKQSLLIEINNARDELNEIEVEILKNILNENQKDYAESSYKTDNNKTKNKYERKNNSDIKFDFSKEYTFTFDRKTKSLLLFGFLLFGIGIFVPISYTFINLLALVFSLFCLLLIFQNYCIKVSKKGILMKWFFIKRFIPIEIIEEICFEEIIDQKFLKIFLNKELNGQRFTNIPIMGIDNELYLTLNAFLDFFKRS